MNGILKLTVVGLFSFGLYTLLDMIRAVDENGSTYESTNGPSGGFDALIGEFPKNRHKTYYSISGDCYCKRDDDYDYEPKYTRTSRPKKYKHKWEYPKKLSDKRPRYRPRNKK